MIEYYLIFAISVSMTSLYLWFWPALRDARHDGVVNAATQKPFTACVIYALITTVIAPLVVWPLLSTSAGERYYTGITKSLREPDTTQ